MLTDRKYTSPPPVADEPRPDYKRALRGVGDKLARDAGLGWAASADWQATTPVGKADQFTIGDIVEYTTPDGINRTGSLVEYNKTDREWLVQVDYNTRHIVPVTELRESTKTPRVAHRQAVQRALQKTSDWQETRAPEHDGEHLHVRVKLGAFAPMPSEDVINAYLEARHNARLVDVSRVGDVMGIVAQALPQPKPSDPTGGEQPGLETEELAGSTGPDMPPLSAAFEAEVELELGVEIEDDEGHHQSARLAGLFVDRTGRLVDVATDTTSPAVVTVTTRGHSRTAKLHGPFGDIELPEAGGKFKLPKRGQVEAPHSSGTGPQSTREDYDMESAAKDGDYVVRAADETAREYWIDYYANGYGKMQVRDLTESGARKDHSKKAQQVAAGDIAKTLADAAKSDPVIEEGVNRVLKNLKFNQLGPLQQPILTALAAQGGGPLVRLYNRAKAKAPLADAQTQPAEQAAPGEAQQVGPAQQPTQPDLPTGTVPGSTPGTTQIDPSQKYQQEVGTAQEVSPYQPVGPDQQRITREQERQRGPVDPNIVEYGTQALTDVLRRTPNNPTPGRTGGVVMERVAQRETRRPAPMGFQVRPTIERLTAQGSYLCMRVTWDPEQTAGRSDQGIKHNIETWVKGISTLKEQYPDIGFIGKIKFKDWDPEAGYAELLIPSSRGKDFPQEVAHVEGEDNTVEHT